MKYFFRIVIGFITAFEMGMSLIPLPGPGDYPETGSHHHSTHHHSTHHHSGHNTGDVNFFKYTYQKGYKDGCKSAKGHWRKNAQAYQHSSQYHRGWDQGFKQCKEQSGNQHHNYYQQGFDDGCSTARGHYRKNLRLYRQDVQYRRGWYSGKNSCVGPGSGSGSHHALDSYQKGYHDGCQSAKGHWMKNEQAYRRYSKYRRGWNEGFRQCRSGQSQGNFYNQGYRDGCSTARGNYRKNDRLYRHNDSYRRGWKAGKRQCASHPDQQWNSYQKGYRDGCRSARGHWQKNSDAYRRYRNYREGWDEGFRQCKTGQADNSYYYNQGYADGCQSARGHFKQNVTLYRDNREYRRGWKEGKRRCRPGDGSHWNAYRQGYRDGCQSGRGHWKRNNRAYRNDTLYRRGWDEGYRHCKSNPPDLGAYARGYHDGCRSARGHYHKDYALYRNNEEYRRGWDEGRRECRYEEHGRYSYEEGYRDGCRSAQGYYYRNENAYRHHDRYRRGWEEGYRNCRNEITIGDYYWRGYRDGCSSGKGHWRKDTYAYTHFSNYRRGWNLGREECGYWGDWSLYWYREGSLWPPETGGYGLRRPEKRVKEEDQWQTLPSQPDQTPENGLVSEIRRMTDAARNYMLAHYLKLPSGEPVLLELSRLDWIPGYAVIGGHPILQNGAIPPARIIDDRSFLFCLAQSSTGEWSVIYDLSYPTRPDQKTLDQIRKTFPENFPRSLLPEEWKQLMEEPVSVAAPAPVSATPPPEAEAARTPDQNKISPEKGEETNTTQDAGEKRTEEENSSRPAK